MNEKFEETKNTYQGIYENTFKINELIEKNDLNEIEIIIANKDVLINKVNELITNTEFSKEEKNEINNIIEKIKTLEDKNIKQLQENQNKIKKELFKANLNYKAISAYKYTKEANPRLVDSKE